MLGTLILSDDNDNDTNYCKISNTLNNRINLLAAKKNRKNKKDCMLFKILMQTNIFITDEVELLNCLLNINMIIKIIGKY